MTLLSRIAAIRCKDKVICTAVILNHKAVKRSHTAAEIIYLVAVSTTAHGVYSIAAGVLLVTVIIHAISGD